MEENKIELLASALEIMPAEAGIYLVDRRDPENVRYYPLAINADSDALLAVAAQTANQYDYVELLSVTRKDIS